MRGMKHVCGLHSDAELIQWIAALVLVSVSSGLFYAAGAHVLYCAKQHIAGMHHLQNRTRAKGINTCFQ
jgi:hypothetical protein